MYLSVYVILLIVWWLLVYSVLLASAGVGTWIVCVLVLAWILGDELFGLRLCYRLCNNVYFLVTFCFGLLLL